MDLLDRLLEHDRWATTQLLDTTRDLTGTQLDQPFDIGHRTVRATLEHMIFNIEAWTALMVREPMAEQPDDTSPAALAGRHERACKAFAQVARRMRDEDRLEDTFADFFDERMTFGGGILHVVLHNAEHRSEAVHILNRLGLPEVPELDHGLWDHVRRQPSSRDTA